MNKYPEDWMKNDLRKQIKIVLAALSTPYRKHADQSITKRILTLPEFTQAKVIFSYISLPTEPDTKALIQHALSSGKIICVPKCGDDHQMKAIAIQRLSACRPNVLGILEPVQNGPEISPKNIDLALIPCVAASKDGKRLGHGGGYYDRFLSHFSGLKCCLCYGACLREDIPVTALDVQMDMVICEDEIYKK